MIVLIALAALTIAYRIYKRLFTRTEAIVLGIFLVNFLLVELQIVICDRKPFPESRYWIQGGILLLGWVAWGLRKLWKPLLPLVSGVLLTIAVAMVAKAHVSGSRRAAFLAANDWAREIIRADWQGPARDAKIVYQNSEYHPPYRPCVDAFSSRLAYELGGRTASLGDFPQDDIPDYIVDDPENINFSAYPGATYRKLSELQIGKRTFVIYRRMP